MGRASRASRQADRAAEAVMARAAHRPQGPLCDQGGAAACRGRRIAGDRRQCARSAARRLLARRIRARRRCSGSMPGLRLRSIPACAPIVLADGNETVGAGAESFRALSVPERSELIVRTHAPQGETVSLVTSRDGAEAKTIEPKQGGSEGPGRVQRGAERADQRRRQDRRPDRFQMALRPDQGRGADHQSDGHADHHAARRVAAGVPRRRR